MKDFANNTFKFDECDRFKFSTMGRKHCGKRRNCLLFAISPFPAVSSKNLFCRYVKTIDCLWVK